MRYIWGLFWTFLLMQMLTYVISSMSGVAFDLKTGTILTIVAAIIIFVMPAVLPNEPNKDEAVH